MGLRSGWEWAIVAGTLVAAATLAFHVVTLPAAQVKTATGLFYVPSCANGPLELDGSVWYPVAPITEAQERAIPITPGDGQGTLMIYSNGRAFFESNGGAFRGWLSTTPQDYSRMCP